MTQNQETKEPHIYIKTHLLSCLCLLGNLLDEESVGGINADISRAAAMSLSSYVWSKHKWQPREWHVQCPVGSLTASCWCGWRRQLSVSGCTAALWDCPSCMKAEPHAWEATMLKRLKAKHNTSCSYTQTLLFVHSESRFGVNCLHRM